MKLPISSPIKPTITGTYGFTSPEQVAWYKARGLNMTSHNGVDFAIGSPELTYGTKLVAPRDCELSQTWWDTPLSTKGNGIQISWENEADRFNVRFWHCSEIIVKPSYKEGDIIGYIGNSGLCNPAPTDTRPFDGSHLHLMVYKNGVIIDPLTIFNKEEWYLSSDTSTEEDLPPLFRVVKYMTELVKNLLLTLKK